MVKVVKKTANGLQKLALFLLLLPIVLFVVVGKAVLRVGGFAKPFNPDHLINSANADVPPPPEVGPPPGDCDCSCTSGTY